MRGNNTHSKLVGYLAWIFGIWGAHRFYYGKPITGIIWFFTFGLFFIGWIIDFFLIPSMDEEADFRYEEGSVDYSVAWILLAVPFFGLLGFHRMYMGKWVTGFIYLFTFGLFGLGILYDYLTLNNQINDINSRENYYYRRRHAYR